MNPFVIIIVIIIALVIIAIINLPKKTIPKKEFQEGQTSKYYEPEVDAYKRKDILTPNEINFYREIKPIIEKYNLHILTKIRVADLVEIDSDRINNKDYMKYFNKINKKHIDFALCDKDLLHIVCLIELDDSSHNKKKRIERDEFINNLCRHTGYILIRTYSGYNFEQLLIENNCVKPIIPTNDQ